MRIQSWEKRPRKPRERKWAKDAQEEANETLELVSNVIKKLMALLNQWDKNKWQAQRGLVGLGQITSQQE